MRIVRRIAMLALIGALPLAGESGAQRATPIAISRTTPAASTAWHAQLGRYDRLAVRSDTSDSRRRLPAFVLGGAVFGGVVGGLLAASYNPCGDPQPGVYCSSTDTATGVVIGALVGAGVGLLAWAIATRQD